MIERLTVKKLAKLSKSYVKQMLTDQDICYLI